MSLLFRTYALAASLLTTSVFAQNFVPTLQPPPKEISPVRGSIVLNGIWRFQPATLASATQPLEDDWGLIPVPGAWMRQGWLHGQGPLPGVVQQGSGTGWTQLGPTLGRAWYERELVIPAEWAIRRVTLNFQRVATDATVFLDGKSVGSVEWPSGQVDLTAHMTPGKTQMLRVLVVATSDPGESIVWMGAAPGQNHVVKSRLPSAGIIGEVTLASQPIGAAINDVFARPSVRRGELNLDVEFSGFKGGESLMIQVSVHRVDRGNGTVAPEPEKSFPPAPLKIPKLRSNSSGTWRQTLTLPWSDAALWDVDQPNLYVARVRLIRADGTLIDDYAQRFGFREFWIEGRNLVLNGVPFRFRPFVMEMGREPVSVETIDGFISGLRRAGFNISQQWASNHDVRGSQVAQRAWAAERADELGWPLIGTSLSLNTAVFDPSWRTRWNDPGVKERWRKLLERELRTMRNHPSILVWGTSANLFNHAQDQNPRSIGRRNFAADLGQRPQDIAAKEAFGWLKQLDPTRPYFAHAGNATGEIYTANTYLNHIPLQEREEWLSDWARDGEMPYLAIEFGNPLFTDFLRGRDAFARAVITEPLATEFAAALLGQASYRAEQEEYRRAISTQHENADRWSNWHANVGILAREPNVQAYQSEFITRTWRAWRTAGISGGMVPWSLLDNSLFAVAPPPSSAASPPAPGQRFAWEPQPWSNALTLFDSSQGWMPLPAGEALLAANGATLAWIAGKGDQLDFYEKQHGFHSGGSIGKQAALLNDLRSPAPFSLRIAAVRDGKEIFAREWSGMLNPAETRLIPFEFTAPDVTKKTLVTLVLTAKIAGHTHVDRFPLHIFSSGGPKQNLPPLAVYDPVGKTAALLHSLKIAFSALPNLNNLPAPGSSLVIIGRDAFAHASVSPEPLLSHVRAGGNVLIATQQPDWLRNRWGLRVSRFLTRQAWPVDPSHPIFQGLDADDFRYWAGESTLVDPKPHYSGPIPLHGWRWSGRGAISSAAIEKPHRSGWRPLLEAEFDLAYSPLLERELGEGRVILSTLDFEDHAERDPAAATFFRQLIAYAQTRPTHRSADKTLYVGGESGTQLLETLAIRFERVSEFPTSPSLNSLLVLGEDASVSAEALNAFAQSGGRALVLGRTAALPEGKTHHGANLRLERSAAPGLSPLPNLPEFAGLSTSDLRVRGETDFRSIVAANGIEVHADGLLGVRRSGSGVIVYAQLTPQDMDVSERPWLRFTRWRHTRALAQLAANLGASFATDGRFFQPESSRADTPADALYHPDYRMLFTHGDEPTRYYRW